MQRNGIKRRAATLSNLLHSPSHPIPIPSFRMASHKFTITRDSYGTPHVRADNRLAAFAGQAFAMCQDRFFQMEVDRRYSSGQLSALLDTPGNRASDAFMCKSRIGNSYAEDLGALEPSSLEMLDAFAAGVNAYIASCEAGGSEQLPPEFSELNLPAPAVWTPLDSLAVFKGRHLTMGTLGNKLARWRVSVN